MKKLITTIASLAVLSTAAYAKTSSADSHVYARDSLMKVGTLHPVSKKLITKFALSHKAMMRVTATPNYINMSQLR